MNKSLTAFLASGLLLVTFAAKAELVNVSCQSIAGKNGMTLESVVSIEKQAEGLLTGEVAINAIVKQQGNNYGAHAVSAAMKGYVVEGQGQALSNGSLPKYRTLFANSSSGDIRRLQLAIGDKTGMLANSFIQDANGVYYFANCSEK